jgi:Mg-chelatase subunit ChlD
MDAVAGISFSRPEALILLAALLPLAVYVSRHSIALLRRAARRAALALRIVLTLLLVLALSGVGIVRASEHLSVVFLLDRSDSVGADQQALQAEYVRSALGEMRENDGAGVIVFGADALVDRPVLSEKAPPDLASAPTTTYSNLADAIRMGLAVSPADTARRLVLLSDGLENTGSAENAARLAAAYGVPVDVVPLSTQVGPEVWINSLKAPSPVRENERISLQLGISSSTDTTATLILLMDGAPLNTQTVNLVRGNNTFVQQVPPSGKGFHTYVAQVIPGAGADTRTENNRYSAFSYVLGKPRILIVEGHEGEAGPLKSALDPSLDADVIAVGDMPADVKALVNYDGIVLVNVPASSMTSKVMSGLQVAVRDLGKGLIVVGGDESYSAGGYARTPLEEMLPISLELPSKIDIPSVAMVLVLDRSGSMESSHSFSGGVTKIELAKEAAYQAVAQLGPKDYAGVVTFDDSANWVLQLQPVTNLDTFRSAIGSITSGGGTDIYSGLSPAVDALVTSNAKRKHIILLTDGVSAGGDYAGLITKMGANDITLSTVAVGADSDTRLLESLAAQGKGRYYFTEDGGGLAQIFAHETHLAARSYIIERTFTPERTSTSPIMEGIGGLPALQGYIGTSPRPNGQVVLVSDSGDPVLAQWQYGLGRVVSWTSDAKGQWAKDWVTWGEFPRFWSQAVRWSTGAEASNTLQPRVELEGSTAHITVDATAPDGSYLNDLTAGATVIAPGLVTSTVQLRQTSAGRYEGEFPAVQEGAYLVQIQAEGAGTGKLTQLLGAVVPYSPEYLGVESDDGLLARLAQLTGGRVLTPEQTSAPFEHNLDAVKTTTDLSPLLLLLAVLLLPFDIGVRRLSFTRADVRRAMGVVRRKLGLGAIPVPALPHASTPEIAAMFSARERVREEIQPEVVTPPPIPTPQPTNPNLPSWAQEVQLGGRMGRSSPSTPIPAPPPESADESGQTLAARLRRAREGK